MPRKILRVALPDDLSDRFAALLGRYATLIEARRTLRAEVNPERPPALHEWRLTDAGRRAWREALSVAERDGEKAGRAHLRRLFAADMRARGVKPPTHGDVRLRPPPVLVAGELLAALIRDAGDRIDTHARLELEQIRRELRRRSGATPPTPTFAGLHGHR